MYSRVKYSPYGVKLDLIGGANGTQIGVKCYYKCISRHKDNIFDRIESSNRIFIF